MKLNVTNFQMRSHINMATEGILISAGEVNSPGHDLHGKTIVKTVVTPKKNGTWGKGEASYYIEDGSSKSPVFEDITSLMVHYNFPNTD